LRLKEKKRQLMSRAPKDPARQSGEVEAASAETYLQKLSGLFSRLPYQAIEGIVHAILQAADEERTIFVFGNGGSAASASHMMCDMNKGTTEAVPGRRPKVMALTDNVPLLTAWANDFGYDRIFSEPLKNFVRRGDVAFAISASGNSPNVLLALETARENGALTLGLTGHQGGKMKAMCDICAVVPSDNAQMIEDVHHAILHSIFTVVRSRIRAGKVEAMTAAGGQSSG
jgi:D-sedoheptulose 7-phosphate isomerase